MLRVCGLSLRYPNGKVALSDFELTVAAGELVVVLGGNGSGKTTLLRCITRTLKPCAGEIWLADTDLCPLEGERLRRARLPLAMISQHASLVRRSTVLTNVAMGALGRHFTLRTALGGLPSAELAASRGHLAEVGLADLAEQRAGTLSGGQAQRVAIARSLAQQPRVLLADEPVASLDPEAAEDIMRLLQRLARSERLAVLCVLHQVELAYTYADRVVGIRDGRIAFDLPCNQVSREAVHRLYIHEAA
ncbi:MAG TPA: phosphonate ABC transporter ATP-binding protein [Xanthobacteraceae bacterium]|nr:phosphonate ABC transporter ATP-binding protein [Xanthobacteraceae bacterium]